MKACELIEEGMSFMPSKVDHRHDGKYLEWVFPGRWNEKHLWASHDDDDPQENPEYRPEWNLDLSIANAQAVMAELGYGEEWTYAVPIDEFIGRCQQWLRRHLGKTSSAEPTTVDQRAAPDVDYTLLQKQEEKRWKTEKGEKWRNDWQSHQGLQKKYVTAADYIDTRAKAFAKLSTQSRKNRDESQSRGAQMISVGRPEGYFNNTIMKALRIAQAGKEHGADYMSIA